MRGFYRVYQDGILVAEQQNVITTAGKKIIADYLAGNASSWAGAIAMGAGDSAPLVSDTALDFEYYRSEVKSRSVSYGAGTGGAHLITIKSYVDTAISGSVYELGLFSEQVDEKAGVGSGTIISYGDSTEPWYIDSSGWTPVVTTPDTTNNRVGTDAVLVGTGNIRYSGDSIDLSAYSPSDLLSFALMKISGTVSTISIRFNSDDSNYFSYSPSVSAVMSGTSYTISSFPKSSWSATGTPDWGNITSIEFITSGTNTYIIDGVRVSDVDTNNPSYAMVSRAVLATPFTKSDGSQMEIEYYVEY